MAIFVFATLLLTGCASSLQQVAPDQDTVFDPSLLGTWLEVHESMKNSPIIVTNHDHQTYEISSHGNDKPITSVYALSLFRINGVLFFDLALSRVEVNGVEVGADDLAVQPLHFFGRIWIRADEVRASAVSAGWLRKNLGEKNLTLDHLPFKSHGFLGDDVTLTSSPQEIRDFAAEYADDKSVFPKSAVFRRKK